jgi:hypothetical protein
MQRMPVHRALTLLFVVLAAPTLAADPPKDPLARARVFYNERLFSEAIAAAEEARGAPERADSADLVAARAYLERYRVSAAEDDLAQARIRLGRIDPKGFNVRERAELIVGLGQALYYDGAPGAAADVFASVLDAPSDPGAAGFDGRERVLDWWASSLDRDAQPRPDIERQTIYQKVRDRMRSELGWNPASAVAGYWLSAAARGQGDLQAAWDAAQAAWVRAPLAPDHGAAVRGDLDRLVTRAIAPERARALAQPPEAIREEWEKFKAKWEKQ